MEKENKTAETIVEIPQQVDIADVDQEQTLANEIEFSDTESEVESEETKSQSKQQNAEFARQRREAERQTEVKEAKVKAVIETLGGVNPYTGEEMNDSVDVDEYLTMKTIEKKGGDPIVDFAKFQKEKAKEKTIAKRAEEQKSSWIGDDKDGFFKVNPSLSIEKLLADNDFVTYGIGKIGNTPLSEIYSGYVVMKGENEKRAKQMAKQLAANKNASPGALSGTAVTESGFFTKEQVQKMTQEEVSKNYETIRKSMARWKN